MSQTRFLVIDDVEAIRTFTSLTLTRMGYKFVETAGSAEAALEKATSVAFDLVLLDINLPSMNGLELLKKLKAQCPATRVVMCSASNSDENIRTAIADGAEGFLVKPITSTSLVGLLQRLAL